MRLQGLDPLKRLTGGEHEGAWQFPSAQEAEKKDPSWKGTLDTLRSPRKPKQKLADWRKEAPIRPVVFEDAGTLEEDTVHLHLQQRLAQRLLSRYRSQGFLHHDLSRACLAQAKDSIPRVVLLGRLALYGLNAERLHEEIVPVAGRWLELDRRDGPLKAYARDAEANTLELLEEAMTVDARSGGVSDEVRDRLLRAAPEDVAGLRPQLEPRAEELAAAAREKLEQRGEKEAADFLTTLQRQRAKVEKELARYKKNRTGYLPGMQDPEEKRQLEENVRSWEKRLEIFTREEAKEPDRIRARYQVRATRVEPIGLVYLWPQSN